MFAGNYKMPSDYAQFEMTLFHAKDTVVSA